MINGLTLIKIGKKIAEVTGTKFLSVNRFNDDYLFSFEGGLHYTARLHKNYDYVLFILKEDYRDTYKAKYEIKDKTIKGFIKLTRTFILESKLGRK